MKILHCDDCKKKYFDGLQYSTCPHKLVWSEKEWCPARPIPHYNDIDFMRDIGYEPEFAPHDADERMNDRTCTQKGFHSRFNADGSFKKYKHD